MILPKRFDVFLPDWGMLRRSTSKCAFRFFFEQQIVQYDSGFIPDILLLTQAPILAWFDGTIIAYYYYPFNYVLHCLLFCYVWWPCMAINV